MNLDLKTSLVAVPVLVHVLIVKVVTGYWEQTDLNLYMRNQNFGCVAPVRFGLNETQAYIVGYYRNNLVRI